MRLGYLRVRAGARAKPDRRSVEKAPVIMSPLHSSGQARGRIDFPSARPLLFVCISLLAGALSTACARPFPSEGVPKMKILVMDFETPPGLRENPKAIRGWWLGSRNIYQNPRAGSIFAERVSAHLAPLPYINLFSRVDLKYYFARKRQRLSAAYDYLRDEEIDDLMRRVPQLDFAVELGADKLLTGRIIENHLSENRTFHFWSSRARIECRMIDVISGLEEWSKQYELKKRFASQFSIQDEIARQLADDLEEEYFRRLAVASLP